MQLIVHLVGVILLLGPTCGRRLESSEAWSEREIPDPNSRDYDKCGRRNKGFVCDPDDVLGGNEMEYIDDDIEQFMDANVGRNCYEDACKCNRNDPGVYLAVVVVRKFDVSSNGDRTEKAQEMAKGLANRFDYGRCGNTVVIFLSIEDSVVYMAGSEWVPKCHTLATFYDRNKQLFTQKRWRNGIQAMINDYKNVLSGENVYQRKDFECRSYKPTRHERRNRDWSESEIPNPWENYRECRSDYASYVCDPDEVLQDSQVQHLNDQIVNFMNQCRCGENEPGVYIAVVVVRKLRMSSSSSKTDTAMKVAQGLAERYDFGRCGNTIVILLSTEDRVLYMSGSRSGSIPKCYSLQSIYNQNKGFFSSGEWENGIRALIEDYWQELEKKDNWGDEGWDCKTRYGNGGDGESENMLGVWIFLGIVGAIVIPWSISCFICPDAFCNRCQDSSDYDHKRYDPYYIHHVDSDFEEYTPHKNTYSRPSWNDNSSSGGGGGGGGTFGNDSNSTTGGGGGF